MQYSAILFSAFVNKVWTGRAMRKRDAKKQAKLQKITTKRAQYEKARKLKRKASVPQSTKSTS